MTAAVVGTFFPQLPKVLYVPLVLLTAFAASGLYGGIAGFLDVKFGSNIVIVTIMLNYIAQNFCGYLVAFPLRAGCLLYITDAGDAEGRGVGPGRTDAQKKE